MAPSCVRLWAFRCLLNSADRWYSFAENKLGFPLKTIDHLSKPRQRVKKHVQTKAERKNNSAQQTRADIGPKYLVSLHNNLSKQTRLSKLLPVGNKWNKVQGLGVHFLWRFGPHWPRIQAIMSSVRGVGQLWQCEQPIIGVFFTRDCLSFISLSPCERESVWKKETVHVHVPMLTSVSNPPTDPCIREFPAEIRAYPTSMSATPHHQIDRLEKVREGHWLVRPGCKIAIDRLETPQKLEDWDGAAEAMSMGRNAST